MHEHSRYIRKDDIDENQKIQYARAFKIHHKTHDARAFKIKLILLIVIFKTKIIKNKAEDTGDAKPLSI